MSPSKFTAKKTTKNIGEEKSTNTENQKHPPVPSITPLFNLLFGKNPNKKFNHATFLCLSQVRTWISNVICCGLFYIK
jgi:hypothetical protein